LCPQQKMLGFYVLKGGFDAFGHVSACNSSVKPVSMRNNGAILLWSSRIKTREHGSADSLYRCPASALNLTRVCKVNKHIKRYICALWRSAGIWKRTGESKISAFLWDTAFSERSSPLLRLLGYTTLTSQLLSIAHYSTEMFKDANWWTSVAHAVAVLVLKYLQGMVTESACSCTVPPVESIGRI